MATKKIPQDNGLVETHIIDVDSWDDFDSLAQYLKKTFDAEIINRMDEVFTRNWEFKIEGKTIVLKHHDDIGNYFVSEQFCPILNRIVADLDQRLC